MAIRLTGSFFDLNSFEYRVDVYDSDFSGSAVDIDVESIGINMDADTDDINSPMIGSRCSIGILAHYEDTDISDFIVDFAAAEENRFWVEVVKVASSQVVWRGIATPDYTGEEDRAPRFVFKMTAICGIATLKKIPYHSGTALYEGVERFTWHLTTALSKLGHADMWGGSDVFIKTAVDWWEAAMSSGATDDALYQAGVEHTAFYQYKTNGDLDKDVISCYSVIESILRAFNARIIQVDGIWWIEQIPYRTASPYYTRHYSKTGTYLGNATNSGANIINQSKTGAKLAYVQYDFLPALRKTEIYYLAKRRRNFMASWNEAFTSFNQNIDSNSGEAILRIKFSINYTVADAGAGAPGITGYFMIPAFKLKIGSYYLKRDYYVENFSAYVKDMEWTTNADDRIYVPINVGVIPTDGTPKKGSITVELLTPPLPANGNSNSFTYLLYLMDMVDWFGDTATPDWYTKEVHAIDPYLEVFEDGTPFVTEDKLLYASTNTNTASDVYEQEVLLGTSEAFNSVGAVKRWNGSDWENAGLWGQGVATRNKHLNALLSVNILNARLTPLRRLNGQLYGDFRAHRLLQTNDGKKWMMQNASWDLGKNTMNGSWWHLDYGVDGVSASPVKIKVNPPGSEPTIDPTPTTGGLSTSNPGFNFNPPPTVLKPISFNATTLKIDEGDSVTSIPIETPALGTEFLAGDFVTVVNPVTGQYQSYEIQTAPGVGDTSLDVVTTTANFDFPLGSYLVVKQNAYSFRLPQGTAEGQIMRWDNTAQEWVVYSGATAGHVLTWNATNGWQAEAPTGGGSGISDGDYGDVTVSGGGTVINIDANVVGDAELRQGAAASVVGRFDSSVGNVADIVSSANHQILRRDDLGQLGWALIITDNISDSAVTTAKINNLAVTTGKLADDAVTTVKILDANVTTAKINNLAVTTGKLADGAVTTVKITDANVTTAKIADSNVTTAKINNSAVTYAKMQNVTATARVLGRKTAGAGVVEELSNTDLYTLLGLTGTANRFALWTGANTLNSDAAFTFNGARMTITGTNSGVGANSGFLNLNAASITGATTFLRASGTINGNMLAEILNAHNGSANSHTIFTIGTGGSNGGDPTLQFTVNGAVTHAMGTDNSDADKWKLTPNASLPGGNNNASIVATNEASPKYGFNRDAPEFTHDVGGRNRSDQYIGINVAWAAGDVFFGTGAGVGPVFTSCFGTHNRLRLKFTTGTAPTANNVIFTLQYKAGFEFNNVGFPSISAGNAATAGEITKFYVGADNGVQFSIVANGALTASTPYELIITFSGY